MFKRYPLLSRILIFLVLPVLLWLVYSYHQLSASLPEDNQALEIMGDDGLISISRDEHGVPTISANSDLDAFFAMGYVHAQDRLWQLALQRWMAAGRMSEIFGKDMINLDIWMRTLNHYANAELAQQSLSSEALASLNAYSDGINRWLEEHQALPLEFRLLDVTMEPWQPVDSLAWMKVFALNLGGNYREELRRMAAAKVLTPEQFRQIFPAYPADAPTTVPADIDMDAITSLLDIQQRLESEWQLGGDYVGSNGWVVAGRHTASGHALLANDPHLGLQIPSLWYVAAITAGPLNSAGMSLVGLPLIIFGRNDHIAWGGTNMMADVQDVYLERIDSDGDSYWYGDELLPFEQRTESFVVKADFPAGLRPALKPVEVVIRETVHGPVISDRLGLSEYVMSMRWTSQLADDTSYEAFYRLNYATDWPTFTAAMSALVAPPLNLLYSDTQGNIGYLGAGRIPIRPADNGSMPVAGWDAANDWQGFVPAEEMPASFNPDQGYLVSANHKPVADDYPYYLSSDWAPPSRAQRITQLLSQRIASGELITFDGMQQMQMDTVSLPAGKLNELLISLYQSDAGYVEQAYEYLQPWQGDMRGDLSAPTIHTLWVDALKQGVFADELSTNWGQGVESRLLNEIVANMSNGQLYEMLSDPDQHWCDLVDTSEVEDCSYAISEAFKKALWQIYKLRGDRTMADWHWQDVKNTLYRHQPFSRIPALAPFFERRIGSAGSPDTINVAGGSFAGSAGYVQDFGAGFRQIIEWQNDGVKHGYINSTGQSGNVLSPHYDDMVQPFNDGELYRLMVNKPVTNAQVSSGAETVPAANR